MTKGRIIACIAAVPVAYLGLCLGIELTKWARIGFDLARDRLKRRRFTFDSRRRGGTQRLINVAECSTKVCVN